MTTVAILPVPDASGERIYRAIAGDKQSTGRTAGQEPSAAQRARRGLEI